MNRTLKSPSEFARQLALRRKGAGAAVVLRITKKTSERTVAFTHTRTAHLRHTRMIADTTESLTWT